MKHWGRGKKHAFLLHNPLDRHYFQRSKSCYLIAWLAIPELSESPVLIFASWLLLKIFLAYTKNNIFEKRILSLQKATKKVLQFKRRRNTGEGLAETKCVRMCCLLTVSVGTSKYQPLPIQEWLLSMYRYQMKMAFPCNLRLLTPGTEWSPPYPEDEFLAIFLKAPAYAMMIALGTNQ